MTTDIEIPWGEMPYDNKTPAEVVHDYAVARGDLSEQYARDQLASWIERYAAHRAEREAHDAEMAAARDADRVARVRVEGEAS